MVINTNYALSVDLNSIKDAIFLFLENREDIKALVKVLQRSAVESFIKNHFKGAMILVYK